MPRTEFTITEAELKKLTEKEFWELAESHLPENTILTSIDKGNPNPVRIIKCHWRWYTRRISK